MTFLFLKDFKNHKVEATLKKFSCHYFQLLFYSLKVKETFEYSYIVIGYIDSSVIFFDSSAKKK
jgi:hypothetical protein